MQDSFTRTFSREVVGQFQTLDHHQLRLWLMDHQRTTSPLSSSCSLVQGREDEIQALDDQRMASDDDFGSSPLVSVHYHIMGTFFPKSLVIQLLMNVQQAPAVLQASLRAHFSLYGNSFGHCSNVFLTSPNSLWRHYTREEASRDGFSHVEIQALVSVATNVWTKYGLLGKLGRDNDEDGRKRTFGDDENPLAMLWIHLSPLVHDDADDDVANFRAQLLLYQNVSLLLVMIIDDDDPDTNDHKRQKTTTFERYLDAGMIWQRQMTGREIRWIGPTGLLSKHNTRSCIATLKDTVVVDDDDDDGQCMVYLTCPMRVFEQSSSGSQSSQNMKDDELSFGQYQIRWQTTRSDVDASMTAGFCQFCFTFPPSRHQDSQALDSDPNLEESIQLKWIATRHKEPMEMLVRQEHDFLDVAQDLSLSYECS